MLTTYLLPGIRYKIVICKHKSPQPIKPDHPHSDGKTSFSITYGLLSP